MEYLVSWGYLLVWKTFTTFANDDWHVNLLNNYRNSIMASLDKNIISTQLFSEISAIIEQARTSAYRSVNTILVQRNWLLGKYINEEILNNNKAEYGKSIMQELSRQLTETYGVGFTKTNLYSYAQFNTYFPINENNTIFHAVSGKSQQANLDAVSLNFNARLSWTHYRILLQEENKEAREWYANEAAEQMWSVRTLQRNISSAYYHRMLASQQKELVEAEMIENTKDYQADKLEYIKNPVIAEFLGLAQNTSYTESDLETCIIDHMEKFLLEMGKGFAFVARQKHIHTEKEDYYIDLVFYNYMLKCFFLIDLKTSKVRHQDVGQIDMYVRMYDELVRQEDDNPTIGLLLCSDTDEDIARYSVLKGNEQVFAAKYLPFLPSQEELRREIETQKEMFYLSQREKK